MRDFRGNRNSTSAAPVIGIERTEYNDQKNLARHPRPPMLCLINFSAFIESRDLSLRYVNKSAEKDIIKNTVWTVASCLYCFDRSNVPIGYGSLLGRPTYAEESSSAKLYKNFFTGLGFQRPRIGRPSNVYHRFNRNNRQGSAKFGLNFPPSLAFEPLTFQNGARYLKSKINSWAAMMALYSPQIWYCWPTRP